MRIILEDLSYNELLNFISHQLPNVKFPNQPVFCVSCAKGYEGDLVEIEGQVIKALGFFCDGCGTSPEESDDY